jgi:hypothetical protein
MGRIFIYNKAIEMLDTAIALIEVIDHVEFFERALV